MYGGGWGGETYGEVARLRFAACEGFSQLVCGGFIATAASRTAAGAYSLALELDVGRHYEGEGLKLARASDVEWGSVGWWSSRQQALESVSMAVCIAECAK
jgi:hypothetical protein